MRRLLVGLCGILVAACSGTAVSGDGGLRVERQTTGDTTVIQVLSGSTWDGPREAVETLSFGTLEGPDETMFGGVAALTPDGTGGVYVYDYQVPAIRQFDAEGAFVRQVGREGQGPGEYLDAVLDMAVRGDGRLQIWDARNTRISLYGPDGTFSEQWPVSITLFTNEAMFLDEQDHTYIKKLTDEPTTGAWPIGLLHLDASGEEVETIPPPEMPGAPTSSDWFLSPSLQWTRGRDGSLVIGVNKTYAFEVRKPDGRVLRIERAVEPAAVGDAEFEAYEARRKWLIENQGQFMTEKPAETARVKPAYRSLHTDPDGRIWVRRYGPIRAKETVERAAPGRPPVWPFEEPGLFDVFEADGTYLGEVHVPADVEVRCFGLEELWGTREGEAGEIRIVRMRVQQITET